METPLLIPPAKGKGLPLAAGIEGGPKEIRSTLNLEHMVDTYKTISKPSPEVLFKEKKSKFYGYAFPIQSEEEIKSLLEEIRKKHPSAGHVCYAWQLGVEKISYRANDDGEPNNSAGMPIYGQIQSFGLTNVLVAVARIFGGTKLGVGGLISAYREASKMALDVSDIVERKLQSYFKVQFEYPEINKVMGLIKRLGLQITEQKIEHGCEIYFSVDQGIEPKMLMQFQQLHKAKLIKLV